MYPEKLTFEGNCLRTTRINEEAQSIYMMDKALQEKESWTNDKLISLSSCRGRITCVTCRATTVILDGGG